ncbi:solanesyl diphosphate synthase 2, chloroplastic-like [Salvia splendens]|uniref:solanesyl diphosphate synthase 2, chloroplastic-like n=1 Tax=Salvia splendens TaxID=180675 RepID=UPI001C27053F|nr:solanesyl diphosphate synthase 2, chloroplastic-like [Salvia splendens]
MMSVTCSNLDFGRARLDFAACGCSSSVSTRNFGKGLLKNENWRRRFLGCRRRVVSTKTPEAFLNGVAAGPPPALDLADEEKGLPSMSDMFEVVSEDLLQLNKNLQSIVGSENPVLMSAAEQIFEAGGKRMRPALVFLASRATAEIAGLKDLTKEHRRLAEIIEMIHTASLIHDDVIDESDMRRGKETVHQLYGTRVAVLAGDFMFAQSSWYLANLENLEVIKLISQVIKDFASGEIKQASSLFDCDVRLDEYLIKSYYKTASLIAASTKGSSIFSGVDNAISEKMYQYGKNLGLSFQVVDDILDFTQSAEQLGKPAGSDLAKGNLTAPVIFALEKETKLRDIIDSEFCETGSLEEAIEIVKHSGGIDRARELAREMADLAVENLHCLPPSPFRLSLEQLVNYNLERIK